MFKKVVFLMVFMFLASSYAFAGTVNLPKTGQTTCYNAAGAVIDCTNTGQDGDWQAGIAWPIPRFTDNGNGTVTDKLTGLIWLQNADCIGAIRWYDALNAANTLSSGVCGLSDDSVEGDWRLPNVNELESLVHAGVANTATWLNTQGFINVQSTICWSSTYTHPFAADRLWVVSTAHGALGWGWKDYDDGGGAIFCAWPVRGTTTGQPAALPKTGQSLTHAEGDDGDFRNGCCMAQPSLYSERGLRYRQSHRLDVGKVA